MTPQNASHIFFMDSALQEAQKALDLGEVPIGALVVDEHNVIIGRGYNQVETQNCQTRHAEILAIEEATKKLGTWRLEKCWLYVTLEPCLMCLASICLSRLEGVAFGAPSPEFGGMAMLTWERNPIYFKRLMILKGIQKKECADMLKTFFNTARKNC